MTVPTGLMEWGQSGTFNARDDRLVIAALANGKTGIVKAPTFVAGAGLTMTVGAFTTICDCGDSTLCVAASTTSQAITLLAGPGSGSRTDIVWLDIDPNTAVWSINLRTQADTVGRLGIKLGQVVMPQGSNLASQATLTPSAVSWVPFPQPLVPVSVSLVRGTFSPSSGGNVFVAGSGWTSEELGASATLWTVNGFVAPVAGIYLVAARCIWAPNATGFRAMNATRNGSVIVSSQAWSSPGGQNTGVQMPAYPVKCAAGDVISLTVFQNTGGSLSCTFVQMSVSQQS